MRSWADAVLGRLRGARRESGSLRRLWTGVWHGPSLRGWRLCLHGWFDRLRGRLREPVRRRGQLRVVRQRLSGTHGLLTGTVQQRLCVGPHSVRFGVHRHHCGREPLRRVRPRLSAWHGMLERNVHLQRWAGAVRWRLHEHVDRSSELRGLPHSVRAGLVVLCRDVRRHGPGWRRSKWNGWCRGCRRSHRQRRGGRARRWHGQRWRFWSGRRPRQR